MDKKQLLAFGLIFLVFIGFQIFMRPSEEQLAAQKRYQDSLSEVYQKKWLLKLNKQEFKIH